MFASFILGQVILAAQDMLNAALGDPGVISLYIGAYVARTITAAR
ncbi:hypothetical protein [Glycomyces salinus]|nr:hypothetical protein [Glycomyces salinus]